MAQIVLRVVVKLAKREAGCKECRGVIRAGEQEIIALSVGMGSKGQITIKHYFHAHCWLINVFRYVIERGRTEQASQEITQSIVGQVSADRNKLTRKLSAYRHRLTVVAEPERIARIMERMAEIRTRLGTIRKYQKHQ